MSAKIHIVNFGQSNGGLTTVGYTIFNIDGTIFRARTTGGVIEYGTGTGVYGANIEFSQFDQLIVLWDTGGTSPRYAVEENRTILAAIQDETDHIRMIWNSIRNQGEVFNKILKAIKKIQKSKDYDDEFQKVLNELKVLIERESIKLGDIKNALNVTVKSPAVKVTTQKVAPYDFSDIKKMIESLEDLKIKVPAHSLAVINDNVKLLGESLGKVLESMPNEPLLKEHIDILRQQNENNRTSRLKKVFKV